MTRKLIYSINFKLDYILKVNDILILRVSDTVISKCHLLLELIQAIKRERMFVFSLNLC